MSIACTEQLSKASAMEQVPCAQRPPGKSPPKGVGEGGGKLGGVADLEKEYSSSGKKVRGVAMHQRAVIGHI